MSNIEMISMQRYEPFVPYVNDSNLDDVREQKGMERMFIMCRDGYTVVHHAQETRETFADAAPQLCLYPRNHPILDEVASGVSG
mmetsp:Transcript_5691/g.12648  ORF Transcript_5691/g.12648 Transcript_5691/m.12648 type:complete len:84 (-) Transcript_5691:626-877(-)